MKRKVHLFSPLFPLFSPPISPYLPPFPYCIPSISNHSYPILLHNPLKISPFHPPFPQISGHVLPLILHWVLNGHNWSTFLNNCWPCNFDFEHFSLPFGGPTLAFFPQFGAFGPGLEFLLCWGHHSSHFHLFPPRKRQGFFFFFNFYLLFFFNFRRGFFSILFLLLYAQS